MALTHQIFYLCQCQDGTVVILDVHPRQSEGFKTAELLRTFKSIEAVEGYVEKQQLFPSYHLSRAPRRRVSPEVRERMRQKKLGALNPNAKGLSRQHKQRIGAKIKGKYQGAENINYGRPRSFADRAKISRGKYLEAARVKRHWVLSPTGEEFLFPVTTPIPDGWTRGRKATGIRRRGPRKRKPQPR